MSIYYFLHIPVRIFNDILIQIHQSRSNNGFIIRYISCVHHKFFLFINLNIKDCARIATSRT